MDTLQELIPIPLNCASLSQIIKILRRMTCSLPLTNSWQNFFILNMDGGVEHLFNYFNAILAGNLFERNMQVTTPAMQQPIHACTMN